MTNQEILTKAIEKAIANGWKTPASNFHVSEWQKKDGLPRLNNSTVKLGIYFDVSNQLGGDIYHVGDLIFNHDFAKALWGNAITDASTGETLYQTRHWSKPAIWKERLQEMVIAEDPIKYLGEHL